MLISGTILDVSTVLVRMTAVDSFQKCHLNRLANRRNGCSSRKMRSGGESIEETSNLGSVWDPAWGTAPGLLMIVGTGIGGGVAKFNPNSFVVNLTQGNLKLATRGDLKLKYLLRDAPLVGKARN